MLFDPSILVREPLLVLAAVLIIVVGKSVAAFAIVRAFGHPMGTALTISASLAQIGEFSFILATLGMSLGLLSPTGRDLILGGAILSILINPLLFVALDRAKPWLKQREQTTAQKEEEESRGWETLQGHTVLVGFGRVGHFVAASLTEHNKPFIVIEDHADVVAALRADGIPALYGNGAAPGMMEAAEIKSARWLLVAIPNALEAGQIIEHARALNPQIEVVARAHSQAELVHFEKHGATHTIMGEHEIAKGMAEWVLASSQGAAH
jgi:CPA2 family monovalent cation:H+ antiporter-2